MNKKDLKDGMEITYRGFENDGRRRIVKGNYIVQELDWAMRINLDSFDDNLKDIDRASRYDIVKVVWNRQEEAEEMTMEELCEELGREIKIKK